MKPPQAGGANQVTIVLGDGREFKVNKNQLAQLDTEKKIQAAIEAFFGPLSDIWVHKNRDGTWAIATGQEPNMWPEDFHTTEQ